MKYILIIIFFLSVCSCTTQRKVEKYLDNNKEFATKYCGDNFKIKSDTLTIYNTDTIRLNYYNNSIDTLYIDTNQTKENIITQTKFKIKEIIKNTPPVTITKIVEIENTAKVENQKIQIEKLTAQIIPLQKFKITTYLIAFIISMILLLYFILKRYNLL